MKCVSEASVNIFRLLRTILGYSLSEMASQAGISRIYLNELEIGTKTNPSIEILGKLAEAYGIETDTLLYFVENKSDSKSRDYRDYLIGKLVELARE